jgi:hypothetical protein
LSNAPLRTGDEINSPTATLARGPP